MTPNVLVDNLLANAETMMGLIPRRAGVASNEVEVSTINVEGNQEDGENDNGD